MFRHFVTQPNPIQTATMVTLATVAFALSTPSGASAAGFSGSYTLNNWSLSVSQTNGSVTPNTGDATSITLTQTSDLSIVGQEGMVDYGVTAAARGNVSFNWDYSTTDPLGGLGTPLTFFVVNGAATPIFNGNNLTANGNSTFFVNQGDMFGFRISSLNFDNGDDSTPAITNVIFSNFMAPEPNNPVPTPESSSLAVFPLILGLGFLARKRKSKQETLTTSP